MPQFGSFTNFNLFRDIKAYLHLKAGLTRGPLPEPTFATAGRGSPGQRPQSIEQESKAPPVFFVVGHGKSGTTWLARLLDAHPEILCLWEGRFFNKDWYREDLEEMEARVPPRSLYGSLSNSKDLRLWLERSVWGRSGDTDEHLANLTRLAVDYFMQQRLAESGKRIVGDKTPFLPGAEVIKEIAKIHPDAKVLHIIRDGRDAEVSWTYHRWNRATDRGVSRS